LIDIERGESMFRKVPTLLVLTTVLALGACDDEIITDAIPVADAAADHTSEASKEGGGTEAGASSEAGEGGASSGDGAAAESAAPDGGSKPDATSVGDEGGSDGGSAATDAPPG
jgi:hypothetical protein